MSNGKSKNGKWNTMSGPEFQKTIKPAPKNGKWNTMSGPKFQKTIKPTPKSIIANYPKSTNFGAPSKKDIISQDKSHSFNPIKSKYPKQP